MPLRKNKPEQTAAAPKKRERRTVWDYPAVLWCAAVACAVLAWLIVTMYFDQESDKTVTVSNITYTYQSSTYSSLGLDIVETPEISGVTVRIKGSGTIIGGIRESDIMVYPKYSTVRGAGTVTLELGARFITSDYDNLGIELIVENPTTVTVVFDNVSEKTMRVTADTSQIAIADGIILNSVSSVPAEVTLTGPTSELEQIDSVVATVTSDEKLDDSVTLEAPLEMMDANGNVVTPQYTTMDSDTAAITLNVLQVRELPLTVDFIGLPTGFDVSSLKYSLDRSTLRVAGPAKTISKMNELSVASLDLSQSFAFDRDYQLSVELPDGIVSQDGITTVTLTFDTTNMASTTLNVSNIRVINVPSDVEVDVLTSRISGVTLYGPADEIEELSADNVLAQVDCQSISVTAGQQTIPVNIQIPSSSRIFAVGSYTVQCAITTQ